MTQASFTLGELMVQHAATQTSLTHLTAAKEQYIEKIGETAYEVLVRDHENSIKKIEEAVKEMGRQNGARNN